MFLSVFFTSTEYRKDRVLTETLPQPGTIFTDFIVILLEITHPVPDILDVDPLVGCKQICTVLSELRATKRQELEKPVPYPDAILQGIINLCVDIVCSIVPTTLKAFTSFFLELDSQEFICMFGVLSKDPVREILGRSFELYCGW